jgi:hypothetical protein
VAAKKKLVIEELAELETVTRESRAGMCLEKLELARS